VTDQENEGSIEIYPNPASTSINIKAEGQQIMEVAMFTIDGREVLGKSYNSIKNMIELNVVDINPGIYFCKIITSKQTLLNKIIVER
jgi:hypothetical protein